MLIADGLEEEKGLFDAETGVDYLSGFVEMSKSPTQLKGGTDAVESGKYTYEPVVWHWFYLKEIDKKSSWKPFSMLDSVALEDSYHLREFQSYQKMTLKRIDLNFAFFVCQFWRVASAEMKPSSARTAVDMTCTWRRGFAPPSTGKKRRRRCAVVPGSTKAHWS